MSPRFLSPFNVFTLLVLATVLVLASYGQTLVILTSGIDLSIGPVIAASVCAMSCIATPERGFGGVLAAVFIVLGAGICVGLVNAALTRNLGLPAVLSTLGTGIILEGIALFLRPQPGGPIAAPLLALKSVGTGPVPYVLIFAVAVGVAVELALRWSRRGLDIRAVGADEVKAKMLGARVESSYRLAYVASSVLAALAGIVLVSVVGVGDAATGLNYTLLTVTVAVLTGTSVFGGRGTVVGVVVAALLLQTLNSSTALLRLGTAWQYWLPALLILAGAATFSWIRRSQEIAR